MKLNIAIASKNAKIRSVSIVLSRDVSKVEKKNKARKSQLREKKKNFPFLFS